MEIGRYPALDNPDFSSLLTRADRTSRAERQGQDVTEREALTSLLNQITDQDHINRLAPRDWEAVAARLDEDQLVALIKGLVTAENVLHWCGGSVSAVIWTYRSLSQRTDRATSDELADWILKRTGNPYLPFGSQNFSARSLAEYRDASCLHQETISLGLDRDKNQEERAKQERPLRKRQRELATGERRTENRSRFLMELDVLPVVEQLCRLAHDDEHPVEFYPTRCAVAGSTAIDELDSDTKLRLLCKLKGRRRGPWKRFKRRLLASVRTPGGWYSTPWDLPPWRTLTRESHDA